MIDRGRDYSVADPSQYWSTARSADRNRAWSALMGDAEANNIPDHILNIGEMLWGQNVGQGPTHQAYGGTDSFQRYRNQGRR